MAQTLRPAEIGDASPIVDLLLADAAERQAFDALLWPMAEDAAAQIDRALRYALTADNPPFREFWHVSEENGRLAGVAHAILLPVPPIYAGPFGPPGLIMPDRFVAPDAAPGTTEALLTAIESRLRQAGARLLLTSHVVGRAWQTAFAKAGYAPLTLYLSRSGLSDTTAAPDIRPATEADIPGIVQRSAENRQVLFEIDPFWAIHPEADARFAAWMTRSLTLTDRDLLVTGPAENLAGYIVAQPASRLHFPPAHAIGGIGTIDDCFHTDFADPAALANDGKAATALLHAAEAAFARRGTGTAFAVCPAGWHSKRALLEAAGYGIAMVWSIKRQQAPMDTESKAMLA